MPSDKNGKVIEHSETAIVAGCMRTLSEAGALVQRNNSGLFLGANGRRVRASMVGAADIIACLGGKFIAVECKARGGRITAAQARYGNAVTRAGGVYLIVRSPEQLAGLLAAQKSAE